MEIKGEEFIRKVQLQQEREELERKLSELEEIDSKNIENQTINRPIPNELDNIMLDVPNAKNDENKKKYLILGIALVVLFLLTIIIIRLLTNDSSNDVPFDSKDSSKSLEMKKIEENSSIDENFQKIINERLKKENDTQQQVSVEQSNKTSNLENLSQNNKIDNTLEETIKKIEEKIETKPFEEKTKILVEQKEPTVQKESKKTVQTLINSSNNDLVNGYFVQVGSFTKTPADSYINKIKNAGLKYKIYKVEVNSVTYNRVLIGPYSSRAIANENIENIKKSLNLNSAFVIKF